MHSISPSITEGLALPSDSLLESVFDYSLNLAGQMGEEPLSQLKTLKKCQQENKMVGSAFIVGIIQIRDPLCSISHPKTEKI